MRRRREAIAGRSPGVGEALRLRGLKLFPEVEVPAAAELKIFGPEDGGVEHCQCDNGKLAVEYMTDWVAEVLAAKPA